MSQSSTRNCTHVKVNGIRCNSPALRGECFCYYHQRAIRGVRTPPKARIHPIALIEDPQSIQFTLMEVINALLRDSIDVRRANLILSALRIAVRNMQNRNYISARDFASDPVKDIPDYPAPEVPNPEAAHAESTGDFQHDGSECDLPHTAAYPPARDAQAYGRRRYEESIYGPHVAERTHVETGISVDPDIDVGTRTGVGTSTDVETSTDVGTSTLARPGSTAAAPTTPPSSTTREQLDAEYFNPTPPANPAPQPAAAPAPPRKPPASVRQSPQAGTSKTKAKAKSARAG